jgi:hypothetical protein
LFLTNKYIMINISIFIKMKILIIIVSKILYIYIYINMKNNTDYYKKYLKYKKKYLNLKEKMSGGGIEHTNIKKNAEKSSNIVIKKTTTPLNTDVANFKFSNIVIKKKQKPPLSTPPHPHPSTPPHPPPSTPPDPPSTPPHPLLLKEPVSQSGIDLKILAIIAYDNISSKDDNTPSIESECDVKILSNKQNSNLYLNIYVRTGTQDKLPKYIKIGHFTIHWKGQMAYGRSTRSVHYKTERYLNSPIYIYDKDKYIANNCNDATTYNLSVNSDSYNFSFINTNPIIASEDDATNNDVMSYIIKLYNKYYNLYLSNKSTLTYFDD